MFEFKKSLFKGLALSLLTATSLFANDHGGDIELVNNNYVSNVETEYTHSNGDFDDTVIQLADMLLKSNRMPQKDIGSIAITSFVNLHNLNSTSGFGRSLAESFFNELFVRGFNVADFRGQRALRVNPTGEFFITRDTKRIANKVQNSYVLVGTYTIADEKVLINARIMDNVTGQVVAAAKAYHKTTDCRILNNCPKPRMIRIVSNELSK
jgi:TolB-like protein